MAWVMVLALHMMSCRRDLCSPGAMRGYGHLLAASGFGRASERAAFVVKKADGSLRLVDWTPSGDLSASCRGLIPAGSIAVAHTHPAGDRNPSKNDVAEAKRIRMPILVITLEGITIARADGTVGALIEGRDWRRQ